MVLHEDDDELDAFLHGCDQLLGHHEVGAVTDEDVDVPVGCRHLHAEAAGDLVTHARVPVLDVVALRIPRAPQLVEVARHRARCAHDDVTWSGGPVDCADDLGL